MDFWVVLPVHSSSQDSSQESETRSSSGQLLTAQQSEDELTEDEENAEERLLKAQHEVQSDSGTGEYPWFSFVDSSSTAEFSSVLIDELGKTTLKAALKPKISMAAIFLAAKTKNEYRLVEHIIKTAHLADPPRRGLYVKSEFYINMKKEIICLESVLLQVLGFQVDVELPHPDVIEICQKLKVNPAVTKKAYHLATASIMATTMCLQHKPVTVACVCVNLAAKWAQIQVQNKPEDGEPWFPVLIQL
ncbi:unnamed protein product [Larinioides sclopetarius]|uniref:Cyclin-like domain-containing protein n=1 Tax=Larinioides sclopetarius TaxID=280406 RepID=A0AAV2B2N4_9ARAC